MAVNAVAMAEERDFSRSSMDSEVLQQRQSRTLAPITSKTRGLAPLNIKPLPKPLRPPLTAPSNREANMKKDENTSSDETSTKGSDSESDSDSDKLPSVPSTPAGMAPPPPLRNIPHQTTDTSPKATRVFSQPLVARPSLPLQPILRPIVSNQSIKLPPKLAMPPSARKLPTFQTRSQISKTSVVPFGSEKFSSDQQSEPGTPQSHTVSGEYQNTIPLPQHTSTPKSKQSLSRDGADGKSEEEESSSMGQKAHRNNETSSNRLTESPEIHVSNESVEAKHMPSSQQVSSANAASDSKPPLSPQAVSKRKPPRAPSKLLQQSISKHSSSSDLSDDDSTISEDSNQSEGRDRFDPVMQQHKLLMVPRVGSMIVTLPPLPAEGSRLPIPRVQSLHRPALMSTAPLPPIPSPDNPQEQLAQYFAPPATDPIQPPSYYEASQAPASPVSPTLLQGAIPMAHQYNGSGNRNGHGMTLSHGAYGITMGGVSQELSQEEFHLSAMEGISVSQIKTLALQYGVDYRDAGGRTPLMYAVLGNQPKMCEALIKLKATVNIVDQARVTPLLWATFHARPDIMRILLKNGASVRTTDPDDRTAFHWAMRTPNIHCLKWLCKYASVPEAINQPDKDCLTPLHWAIMSDQAAHVKMLLNTDRVDVSMQDSDGRAALNYAVLNFSPSCIRAVLDYNEGAVSLIDMKGRTALHYACAEGSADCVRSLLSYKSCNLHAVDHNGTTPLHWAAAANQPGLIQLLLRRGADRGQRDNNERTPLDYAQQHNHVDCVKILQSYGLRRPGSSMSLASHASINAAIEPPTLDEHGHVIFKTVGRRFSFLRQDSISSSDRLPADGQAQAGIDGQSAARNRGATVEETDQGGPREWLDSDSIAGPEWTSTTHPVMASVSQENLIERVQLTGTGSNNDQVSSSRKSWLEILFCGLCASCKHNRVAPT